MPRKYELLWLKRKGFGFWYVNVRKPDGKYTKHYLGKGKNKTRDIDSYERALEAYKIWVEDGSHPPDVRTSKKRAEDKTDGRIKSYRPKDTIEGLFDRYLADLIARRETVRTPTLNNHILAFQKFIDFTGSGFQHRFSKPKRNIIYHRHACFTSKTIIRFSRWLLTRASRGQLTHFTARKYLSRVRAFGRWCDEQEHLTFRDPRESAFLPVPDSRQDDRDGVKVWNNDELQKLWRLASDRMRLWIILSLNTAYTQKDIATLKVSNIEFDADGTPVRIIKGRTKTRNRGSFLLWYKTRSLLLEWLDSNDLKNPEQYLFRSRYGNLLVRTEIKERITNDNRLVRYENEHDSIGVKFRFLKKEAGLITKKSFRHIRKTAATALNRTLIESQDIRSMELEMMFLSHKPRTLSRTAYINLDLSILDEPLSQLEYYFGEVWSS